MMEIIAKASASDLFKIIRKLRIVESSYENKTIGFNLSITPVDAGMYEEYIIHYVVTHTITPVSQILAVKIYGYPIEAINETDYVPIAQYYTENYGKHRDLKTWLPPIMEMLQNDQIRQLRELL